MIPKKIHYIWLGGKELPKMVKKCMKSWKKYCPDYEIIRWDESNLNLDINRYCRQAYDSKKYAFASDVLRFEVLKNEGGIYLDVDVELIKPLDDLLDCKAFGGLESWGEKDTYIAPGLIFGSEQNGSVVSDICKIYHNEDFILDNGEFNYETVGVKTTNYLIKKLNYKMGDNLQDLGEIIVYPTDYFCPINAATKEEKITNNTYSKHLYLGSWVPKKPLKERIISGTKKMLKKILGNKTYDKIKNKVKDKK